MPLDQDPSPNGDSSTETAPGDGAVGESWARPEPGTHLGRYALLEEIGAGAMGVVYAARDTVLGRDVALKVIRPRRVHNQRAQLRFEREARLLAAVEHPGVVEVYDVGRHAGRSYLVMPRLSGRTLRDWLRRPRTREEILVMFEMVGAGLSAAHAVGVLHCDFKPDNVLLDDADRPKVADFGLARLEVPETQDGAESEGAGRASGTPAYLAPELYDGEAPSVASETYAFHVALYEALLGRRPFRGRDIVRAKLRGVDRSQTSGLPRPLRRRLQQGLAPDPSARLRTFGALVPRPRTLGAWALPVVAGAFASVGVAVAGPGSVTPTCAQRAGEIIDDPARWDGRPDNAAAAATVDHVHRALDAWRAEWSDAFLLSCETGKDVRTECLAKVRIAGESWMRPPASGGSEIARTTRWSGRLTSVPDASACDNLRSRAASAFAADLAEIRFSLDRGHVREGVALAFSLVDRAAAQDEPDTRFAAQILAAEGLGDLREYERAEAVLRDVTAEAEATGRWKLATEACIQLIWVVGVGDTDLEEARVLARRADAYAVRADEDVRLRVGALAMLSGALERRGELAEAGAVVEDGLALVRQYPETLRLGHGRGVLVARRVSLAAKRNELGVVLESADAIADLETERGPFSGSVLTARSALAHAQGVAGDFDASIAGFDGVAGRYAQMGDGMRFWVHQIGVNAAIMEIRAGRAEQAQARLELACPAMAAERSETQTNVLLCSLALLRARAQRGDVVDLNAAFELLGTVEGRYDASRIPVQQGRVAVAEIAVTQGEVDRAEPLLSATFTVPALQAQIAWLNAETETDPARAVAKYESVCAIASPTLRPDLCLRALDKLAERSLTIDVDARKRDFLNR